MDDAQRRRLDAALEDGEHWRAFATDELERIERVFRRPIPETMRHVWSRFGSGTIQGSKVYIYDPDEVIDLLEQYTDRGLRDLLPFAADHGSRDFAVDFARRRGLLATTEGACAEFRAGPAQLL